MRTVKGTENRRAKICTTATRYHNHTPRTSNRSCVRFLTITSNCLESATRRVQNWSYFREMPHGHAGKRGVRLSMGVVTEVPRQQVARRVAQLDVCVRLRPMCFRAFESGPGLAGYRISDLIEPLFRRVAPSCGFRFFRISRDRDYKF